MKTKNVKNRKELQFNYSELEDKYLYICDWHLLGGLMLPRIVKGDYVPA